MEDGEIVWSSNPNEGFAATTVGCGGAAGRQEREYEEALAGVESYRLDGDRLELRDGRGRTTVTLRQQTRSTFDPAVLEDTRWKVRSVDGERPVEGSVPTVHYGSGNTVTWYDGCEGHRGTYEETDYGIEVQKRGPSGDTCVKPETYTNPDGPCVRVCFYPDGLYGLRDGLLEIVSQPEGTVTVLEPLGEDVWLNRDGTPWEFRRFVEGDRRTPVRGGADITLTFDRGTLRMGEGGTMFGFAGCNDYRIAYEYPITRNGLDRLTLEEPVVTRRTCDGPRSLAEQEERFLGILADVAYYPDIRIGGLMTLETEDGRKLVFTAPE